MGLARGQAGGGGIFYLSPVLPPSPPLKGWSITHPLSCVYAVTDGSCTSQTKCGARARAALACLCSQPAPRGGRGCVSPSPGPRRRQSAGSGSTDGSRYCGAGLSALGRFQGGWEPSRPLHSPHPLSIPLPGEITICFK